MDYPFSERNWICRTFGHRKRHYQSSAGDGVARWTCDLDGHTEPPFRKLAQVPPYDYLPDDQQPAGAI
jgi:hypothetical protein